MSHPLASVDIFKGLDDKELSLVEGCAEETVFPADRVIFREGDEGDKMFLVKQGVVEIWKSDGKELKGSRLARLKENEVFGEMAIFDKEPRSASAYAVIDQEIRLWVWKEQDLNRLIQNNPAMGSKVLRNILEKMSRRLRNANDAVHTLLRANRYIGL